MQKSAQSTDGSDVPAMRRALELAKQIEADAEWGRLATGDAKGCICFINEYCITLNPDAEPAETRFELYDYQAGLIRRLFGALFEQRFVHIDKSRQMGISWLTQAFKLYCLLFVPGFSSLTLSRKANDVDDGGENSTADSLFGRVRFMFEKLPDWMRERADAKFTHLRVTAACNPGAFLVGEGANPEAARHGSYMFGDWDEMARTPFARTIRAGWRRSVRSGIYLSTPKGKNNEFARLKKTKAEKLEHTSIHWRLHPAYGEGAYRDEDGRWRSPWYDRETQDMTDDEVAGELDISYEGSVAALIYKEWSPDFIVSPDIPYDPALPLCMGWDFGIADDTFVEISQISGKEERILRAYSGSGMLPHQHFANIETILEEIGFYGESALCASTPCVSTLRVVSDIRHYADPSGLSRSIATGSSVIHEYEMLFTKKAVGRSVRFNTPRHSVEDGIRACRRRLKAGLVRVSGRAAVFIDAIEAYGRETDREGNVKEGAAPRHDWSSHPMDGWRYRVTGVFGVREGGRRAGARVLAGGRKREDWKVSK
ncbi:MAG: hypothetical protein ABIH66_06840 [bacterium]